MKAIVNSDTFGRRLRNYRLSKGLSQSKLAELIGTSNRMISLYERDEARPTIEVLSSLSKALDTSVALLMGEAKFPDDPELESILRDIQAVPEEEQERIKHTIVSLLKISKLETVNR